MTEMLDEMNVEECNGQCGNCSFCNEFGDDDGDDDTYDVSPFNPFYGFNLEVELMSEDARLPERGTADSAGLDVFTPKTVDILPHSDVIVPLDIRVRFPKGFAMVVDNKSGRATKNKMIRGAGVVDADYRGNVMIHLFNLSDNTVCIPKGEKIAQLIIYPIWTGDPIKVESISTDTERGEGGFGSTGV